MAFIDLAHLYKTYPEYAKAYDEARKVDDSVDYYEHEIYEKEKEIEELRKELKALAPKQKAHAKRCQKALYNAGYRVAMEDAKAGRPCHCKEEASMFLNGYIAGYRDALDKGVQGATSQG